MAITRLNIQSNEEKRTFSITIMNSIIKLTFLLVCLLIANNCFPQSNNKYRETTVTPETEIMETDTLSVYSGNTVSDEKKIVSEQSLEMDNTTVITGGNLQATANDAIIVLDETMVALGGELQLNGAGQYAVRYTYDASGNRVRQEKDETVK